jgi:hypothetical protein
MNSRRFIRSLHRLVRAATGHGETKRLRGLEIDRQVVLGRCLHRQVSRLLAFEDAVDCTEGRWRKARCFSAARNDAIGPSRQLLHLNPMSASGVLRKSALARFKLTTWQKTTRESEPRCDGRCAYQVIILLPCKRHYPVIAGGTVLPVTP